MVSRNSSRLTRAELAFWLRAFLARASALNGGKTADEGAAHRCADFANAAVTELRRLNKGASR